MENYLPLLQSTSLFAGISAGELRPLLSELGACIRSYGRGEALVQAGAPSRRVGVVLTGSIEAYRPAPGGARIPITHMGPGGVFGDVLGGSSLDSPVTVVASAPCEVLLFPYEKLLQPDGSAARQRLLQNLVRTISDKYFLLSRRVDLLVMKTLRAKVCAYLLSEAEQQSSMTFTIPFPHPVGRLPQLRPQRPFPGVEPDAAGRAAGYLPFQLQAAGAGGSAADDSIKGK